MYLKAWALEHFTKLYMWNPNPNYEHAKRFLPTRGHVSVSHHRGCLDRLVVEDVIFILYSDNHDVVPFRDIFWCSGWIMANTTTECRYLSERVMRHYMRMKNVAPLDPPEIAHTFKKFMIHVIHLMLIGVQWQGMHSGLEGSTYLGSTMSLIH